MFALRITILMVLLMVIVSTMADPSAKSSKRKTKLPPIIKSEHPKGIRKFDSFGTTNGKTKTKSVNSGTKKITGSDDKITKKYMPNDFVAHEADKKLEAQVPKQTLPSVEPEKKKKDSLAVQIVKGAAKETAKGVKDVLVGSAVEVLGTEGNYQFSKLHSSSTDEQPTTESSDIETTTTESLEDEPSATEALKN